MNLRISSHNLLRVAFTFVHLTMMSVAVSCESANVKTEQNHNGSAQEQNQSTGLRILKFHGNVSLENGNLNTGLSLPTGVLSAKSADSWVAIGDDKGNRFLLKNGSLFLTFGYPLFTDYGYVNDPTFNYSSEEANNKLALNAESGKLFAHINSTPNEESDIIIYSETLLIEPNGKNTFLLEVDKRNSSVLSCGGSFFIRPYFAHRNLDLTDIEIETGKILLVIDKDLKIKNSSTSKQAWVSRELVTLDVSTTCTPP